MGGWGGFLGGLMDKMPIQGRTERWKNELDNLTKERKKILLEDYNEKRAARLDTIDRRREYLIQLLKNKA